MLWLQIVDTRQDVGCAGDWLNNTRKTLDMYSLQFAIFFAILLASCLALPRSTRFSATLKGQSKQVTKISTFEYKCQQQEDYSSNTADICPNQMKIHLNVAFLSGITLFLTPLASYGSDGIINMDQMSLLMAFTTMGIVKTVLDVFVNALSFLFLCRTIMSWYPQTDIKVQFPSPPSIFRLEV